MPALNQTGLLNAAFWCTSRCVSSSRKISAASGVAKYPCLFAHPWMVRTTRPINCLTLRSRSGVPITPRKYFETTTLVATCDQPVGISTSCCSKTTSPFPVVMSGPRVSHWTSSKGATPGRVKYRFQERPFRLRSEALAGAAAVTLGRSVDVFWVDRAIDETSVGWGENGMGWGGERPTSYAVGWSLSSSLPQPVGFPDSAGHNICPYGPDAGRSRWARIRRDHPASSCASPGPTRRPLLRHLLGDLPRVRPLPAEAAWAGSARAGRRHPTYMGAGFGLPVGARLLRRPPGPHTGIGSGCLSW